MKNPNLGNRDLLLNRFATYTNCPASLEEQAVMEVFSQTGPVLGVCMVCMVHQYTGCLLVPRGTSSGDYVQDTETIA